MSRSLAVKVAKTLKLDFTPSAFQGRIGAAKGLWIMDCSSNSDDQELWIQITESQEKFLSNESTKLEDCWRTLEVLDWSSPHSSASLTKQFIPILEGQGVHRSILAGKLRDDLSSKIDGMKSAMKDPVLFRKWCQDLNGASRNRTRADNVQWDAGLPSSDGCSNTEQISFLLEVGACPRSFSSMLTGVQSGFKPQTCAFLESLAWAECQRFCNRLTDKLNCSISQSWYGYCVPDPLDVLKPNEIHVGFSTPFRSRGNLETEMVLHEIDATIARSPAHMPTDIRKVQCVFEPRLRALKDVVVFPTTSEVPLAHLLSGGDYDGDKVWVCWDRDIVEPFRNAPLPANPVSLSLESDQKKIADHTSEPPSDSFLHHCLRFNSRPLLLGLCTNYKDRLCYSQNSVASEQALTLSQLLSNLVDSRKAGHYFDMAAWDKFREHHKLPTLLDNPVYKKRKTQQLTKRPGQWDHVLDYLFFDVADDIAEKARRNFQTSSADRNDPQLADKWHQMQKDALGDQDLLAVLKKLSNDLDAVRSKWVRLMGPEKHGSSSRFKENLITVYSQYTAIVPESRNHPLVFFWKRYAEQPWSDWKLLKASAVFANHSHFNAKFPWYMAGRELGFLKSQASGFPRSMIADVYQSLKSDGAYIERQRQARAAIIDLGQSDSDDSDDSEVESQYYDARSDVYGDLDSTPD